MIINLNLNTEDPLSEHDKVVLLALAGEISLNEGKTAEAPEPVQEAPGGAVVVLGAVGEHTPSPEGFAVAAIEEAIEGVASVQEKIAEAAAVIEPEKAPKKVNVSEASLKKYGFHIAENGEVTCDHCEHVSETGRALHLHAGTHTQAEKMSVRKTTLKSVPEKVEDAYLSTEEDVADAEVGDPEPDWDNQDAPEQATVVETDPKLLRDKVAKVATAMVAAERQADVRKVLDNDLGGVARVSMIAEGDLQKFLDSVSASLSKADRDKFFKDA